MAAGKHHESVSETTFHDRGTTSGYLATRSPRQMRPRAAARARQIVELDAREVKDKAPEDRSWAQLVTRNSVQCLHARNKAIPADRVGQSCGLSVQAESGGAGHGAWEISPAT